MDKRIPIPSFRVWKDWPADNDQRLAILVAAQLLLWGMFLHTEGLLAQVGIPTISALAGGWWIPVSLSGVLLALWTWLPRPFRLPAVLAVEFLAFGLAAIPVWRGEVTY